MPKRPRPSKSRSKTDQPESSPVEEPTAHEPPEDMHAVEELTGPVTLTVPPEDAGQRLDRWLAGQVPQLSRARLQTLIREGAVTSGRETIGDGNLRVKPGEVYRFVPPEPEPSDVAGENIALDIVYEDADVIVIDKPAGLVVHPAAGHASGTLVNALVAHCRDSLSGIGGIKRPGIVHRLDKDTSGLLVVAKNDAAHQSLSEQFKSHGADGRLERVYKALVWGQLQRAEGTIDAPLARSTTNRQKISVTRGESGRHAITRYRVLETFAGGRGGVEVSLVELRLETGRTHQIRVHLAHIGHPVLGMPHTAPGSRRAPRCSIRARGLRWKTSGDKLCTLHRLLSSIPKNASRWFFSRNFLRIFSVLSTDCVGCSRACKRKGTACAGKAGCCRERPEEALITQH